MTAKYIITDTFKITGRGLVLAGYIEEGVIYIGDYIEFNVFDKRRKRKITGIEGIRKASPDRTNTGLLIKCEDESEIDELRTWQPNGEVGIILKESGSETEMNKFTLIFLETSLLLSTKKYTSWREIQDEYEDYKASLDFTSLEGLEEYIVLDYKLDKNFVSALLTKFVESKLEVMPLDFQQGRSTIEQEEKVQSLFVESKLEIMPLDLEGRSAIKQERKVQSFVGQHEMEYFKIQKTVNQYRFEPDYVNFESVNPKGPKIPSERLLELKKQFSRKFKYDLVVYKDTDGTFGFLSMGQFNNTNVEYPLIKEFNPDKIDSFGIKSLHPTRGGGHLEVVTISKSGEREELFFPVIPNIGYDIWDWCVDKYIIKPMEKISLLTGIKISEIVKEYDY